MKKLFFASYNLDIGGIEKALVNLLKALDYDKYDVTLLLQEKKGIFLSDLPKEVKVEEYKLSKCKIVIFRKIINRLKLIFYILKKYKKYDFSCAYATYDTPSTIIARYLSNNTCIYVHSDYTKVYDNNGFRKFFDDRKIDKFKHIIFVSEDSKNNFINEYKTLGSRCKVINNQVSIDEILTKSKEKINIKKKGYTFIFVGRLSEKEKKVSRMINAIDKLTKEDVYLWLIADGPDRKEYEEKVKKLGLEDRIIFLGKKSNPYSYLKQADSFLLTSDYEGFPVVYLESIILKKQIVTTMPLKSKDLDISKYAYIVNNKDDLVKTMKEVMNKPKKIDYDVDKLNKQNLVEFEKVINDEI